MEDPEFRLNEEWSPDDPIPYIVQPMDDKLTMRQSEKLRRLTAAAPSATLPIYATAFIVTTGVLFQIAIGLGSYSGEGSPPMFGDFEAQRHWMEITYHLPRDHWYVSTPRNNLSYWGLDYPPLTAFHSFVMGYIVAIVVYVAALLLYVSSAHRLDRSWVAIKYSQGIESPSLKVFMRMTSVVSHLLIFTPATLLFFYTKKRGERRTSPLMHLVAFVLYPGLLCMDHGHFQYNSASLGLFLAAYTLLIYDQFVFGSIAFSLALNYKQMELYHSLPIFCFILGRIFPFRSILAGQLQFNRSFFALWNVAATVIMTFCCLWGPFCFTNFEGYKPILRRIFPFERGLYEDKVASFWCAFSWLIKFDRAFSHDVLIKLSAGVVLLMSLPALLKLYANPSARVFRLSLFIVSLNFFLFSFQVHEKSILLAAVPALLLFGEFPHLGASFLHISNTSLFSLCLKDNNGVHLVFFVFYFFLLHLAVSETELTSRSWLVYSAYFYLRAVVGVILCMTEILLTPPPHLPHLFPLLSAFFSCCCFLLDLVHAYALLWREKTDLKPKTE